jgi:uncharacterized membrane protein YoaK (UPF0700 family)
VDSNPISEASKNADDQAVGSGLFALTFNTGLIDAVSFIAMGHVFTANMTGNIVFMAFAVAGVPGLSIARSATSLAAFMLGAVIGGIVNHKLAAKSKLQWINSALAIETVLLVAAAGVSYGLRAGESVPVRLAYVVIIVTAIAMGIRNAVVRKVALPDLTTTVLTRTVTGLASESFLAGGTNPSWRTRSGAILTMFLGALAGALLLRYGPAIPLAVSGAVSLGVIVLLTVHFRTTLKKDRAQH